MFDWVTSSITSKFTNNILGVKIRHKNVVMNIDNQISHSESCGPKANTFLRRSVFASLKRQPSFKIHKSKQGI